MSALGVVLTCCCLTFILALEREVGHDGSKAMLRCSILRRLIVLVPVKECCVRGNIVIVVRPCRSSKSFRRKMLLLLPMPCIATAALKRRKKDLAELRCLLRCTKGRECAAGEGERERDGMGWGRRCTLYRSSARPRARVEECGRCYRTELDLTRR